MKKMRMLLGPLVVLLVSPLTAHANLIVNGAFESGTFSNNGGFNYMILGAGATDLTGWTIDSEIAWGLNATDGFSASEGAGFVDLSSFGNHSPTGQISQSVITVSGTTYTFSIDRQGLASVVSFDGVDLALVAGATNGDWTTFTGTFTATSSSTLVSIRNTSPSDQVVFIDAISLDGTEAPPTNVPEPGTLSLVGAGLVGLGFRRRRHATA